MSEKTYTPAEIIIQAKQKAEKAILETCSGEIQRICNAFSYDTGIPVSAINFSFVDVTTIGSKNPENLLNGPPTIYIEDFF